MTIAPQFKGLPVLGLVPRMMRDPLALFTEAHRRFGPVVCLDFGRLGPHFLVTPPDGVHEVLTGGKRREFKELQLLLSEGLALRPTGEPWRRQRRMLQPLFSHRRLVDLHRHIAAAVEDRLEDRWRAAARSGAPIDAAIEFRELAFHVIVRSMFGTTMHADIATLGEDLTTVLDFVHVRLLSPLKLPLSWPLPAHRRFAAARARLRAIASHLVAERRRSGREGDDLLGLLLGARDEETGAGLSDMQIHDEVLTMVLAGHETTATALTWTLWLLVRHPAVWARLRAEVDAVLAGRSPGAEDLPALAYARQVLLEGIRLYPPVWTTHRAFDEPHVVCGFDIPRDTKVMVCPWVTHRLPEHWPDPERFDPDRFEPARSAARPRHAYFPFAGGPHQCIGNEFALTEGVVALALIAQRFDVELVDPGPVPPRVVFTITPKTPIRVRVRDRAGS